MPPSYPGSSNSNSFRGLLGTSVNGDHQVID